MKSPINVNSEIGKLKTVILKRPGIEIDNLTPEYLHELLFDDIPYLPVMQDEHDAFAKVLIDQGVNVLYLEELLAESLNTPERQLNFVSRLLAESNFLYGYTLDKVKDYLLSLAPKDIVTKITGGIRVDELGVEREKSLLAMTLDYPFYVSPMPNLYFTRDPVVCIGNGVSLNRMKEPARRKESFFMKFIIENHEMFNGVELPIWLNRDYNFSIEGGDILVLKKDVLAIGISARTTAAAIEHIAKNLFAYGSNITKVLAVSIPKKRAFMHLDTVFTMLDRNMFSIHPWILDKDGNIDSYLLEKGDTPDTLNIKPFTSLSESLKQALGENEIEFIPCAGGDIIASSREQWSDGTNTLAIAPGVVVTYDRNYITNRIFRRKGLEVIEVKSAELSRGRGGPRCMSMPIFREDI